MLNFVEDNLNKWLHEAVQGKYAVAWRNIAFDPTLYAAYLEPSFVPATDYAVTLGDEGDNELLGFYQIKIRTAMNSGTELEREILDLLKRTFTIGKTTSLDSRFLRLRHRQYSSGGQTTLADFGEGSVEKVWQTTHFTTHFLARERRGN